MSDVIHRGQAVKIDADLTVKALTTDSLSTGAVSASSVLASARVTGAGLTSTSSLILPTVTAKTGTAPTIAATDVVCLFTDTTQAVVLPAVASNVGRILMLKCGTGSCTVTGNASETIDGGAGTLLLTPNKGAILFATSSGWWKLADV